MEISSWLNSNVFSRFTEEWKMRKDNAEWNICSVTEYIFRSLAVMVMSTKLENLAY